MHLSDNEKNRLKLLYEMQDTLIKCNIKTDSRYQNREHLPFHRYILANNYKKIKEYIDVGYDVNTKDLWGRTALYYAIFSEKLETVKMLINAGGDYHFTDSEYDGCNLLQIAATEGHLDMVRYFVEKLRFDVNFLDNKGADTLSYAMLFEQFNIAEYLILHGAEKVSVIDNIDVLLVYLFKQLSILKKKIKKQKVSSLADLRKIKIITNFIASC